MKDCQEIAVLMDSYLRYELSEEETKQIERHLARCPRCYKMVCSHEPSKLFSLLAFQEKEEGFWERLWSRIKAAIEGEKAPVYRFRWNYRVVASVAAGLLIALVATFTWLHFYQPEKGEEPSLIAEPWKVSGEVVSPEEAEELNNRYPTVEKVESPDVRVYNLLLEDKTNLILIFGSEIDL
ncbi:MAG: zf-HC2 domain-containing protein [Candidatus Aminicenantes bacterium]|nr:zf-HC2 domain-containing protein [Candidatus Aminicenantes bacterium]